MSVFDLELVKDTIKKSPTTTFFIVLLLVSFLGSYVWGNGPTDLDTARLFGSITPFDATTDGLIRTLTYIFHQIGGPIHLLMNLGAIMVTGPYLERIYGPVKYTAFFLITGVFGGLFTLMFSDLNVISGGASGSGYGLIGLYLGLVLKKDPWLDQDMRNWVLNLLWINMVWTFFVPGISISGHMGGLISGVIIAALFSTGPQVVNNWFSSIVKSIATFIGVVIVIKIPQMISPNTPLPYIQEIRDKVELETIYDSTNLFNNDLIYNLTNDTGEPTSLPNVTGNISLNFVKVHSIELIIVVLLTIVISLISRSLITSRKIKKLIKVNANYQSVKKHKHTYLLNQIGYDTVYTYKHKHPKIEQQKIVKKTEFELQSLFGTLLQKIKYYAIRSSQIIILSLSVLLIVLFISILGDNVPELKDNLTQISVPKIETTTSPKITEDDPLNSLFVFGYDNIALSSVFNDKKFAELKIHHASDHLSISGYYKGNLVASKNPFIEIVFAPYDEHYVNTLSVVYNNKKLGNKGTHNIVDLLLTSRKSYGEIEIIHNEDEIVDFLIMNGYVDNYHRITFHGFEGDNYVIQVYEDMGTHTATLNWYYVNKYTLETVTEF